MRNLRGFHLLRNMFWWRRSQSESSPEDVDLVGRWRRMRAAWTGECRWGRVVWGVMVAPAVFETGDPLLWESFHLLPPSSWLWSVSLHPGLLSLLCWLLVSECRGSQDSVIGLPLPLRSLLGRFQPVHRFTCLRYLNRMQILCHDLQDSTRLGTQLPPGLYLPPLPHSPMHLLFLQHIRHGLISGSLLIYLLKDLLFPFLRTCFSRSCHGPLPNFIQFSVQIPEKSLPQPLNFLT